MSINNDARTVEPPQFDVLLASLYYLLSRYGIEKTPDLAKAIANHFDLLHRHPGNQSAILKTTGKRLALQWARCICNHCAKSSGKSNTEDAITKLPEFNIH